MNVVTEELPGCKLKVTLSFDVNDVNAAFGRVYADLNKRGQVRGFRPGRAPKQLLIRHFGEKMVRNSAWYELLEEPLRQLLQEHQVIEEPRLPAPEEVTFAEGEPAEVALELTVGPRVTLGDFSDLELVKPSTSATEEEINEVLTSIQEAHVVEQETDRAAVGMGDAVDLNLTVMLEGEQQPVDEVSQTIVVGKGAHFPPVDDKLIGHLVGQEVVMDVVYPEDYHDPDLAGRSAKIVAKIAGLRERKIPPLDDNLARQVNAKYETLDELVADIRRQIEQRHEDEAREELEAQVAAFLLRRSKVDVPKAMVDTAASYATESLADDLQDYGMGLEEFRDLAGLTDQEFEMAQEVRARRLLKLQALMQELEKHLGIEVTEADIAAEVERYAARTGGRLDLVQDALKLRPDFRELLERRCRRRKLFDHFIATARLQEMPREEYHQRREELVQFPPEEVAAPPESVGEAPPQSEGPPPAEPSALVAQGSGPQPESQHPNVEAGAETPTAALPAEES